MIRLTDYVAVLGEDTQIRFEYCYLDENMKPYVEESLSFQGKAGDFSKTMKEKFPMILYLFATCGEANDFEVVEDEGTKVIRYIDFR